MLKNRNPSLFETGIAVSFAIASLFIAKSYIVATRFLVLAVGID